MDISSAIHEREVLSSSQLLARLTAKGLTSAKARQQMRRASLTETGLWRSQSLALPRNERLYARRSFVTQRGFFAAVGAHLPSARPGLARCLAAAERRPVLLEYEISRLTASLLSGVAGARVPTVREEMAALAEVGLRHDSPRTSLSRMVKNAISLDSSDAHALDAAAKRAIETQVVRILGEHYRRHNIIAWTSLEVADSNVGVLSFNRIAFTATAFSWLRPLVHLQAGKKARPTPVMFDAYARTCFEEDVASFTHRLSRARHVRKLSFSLLGVVAAYDFTTAAFEMAKKEGLLVANLKDFFGEVALNALVEMESVLSQLDSGGDGVSDKNLEALAGQLKTLQNHPLLGDLKGLALETVAALIARSEGWENVRLGVDIPFKEHSTRDVDVLAMRDGGERILAIECKAHRGSREASGADVKKFLTETIPAIVKGHSQGGVRPKVTAEFWTTGSIGSDAIRAKADNPVPRGVDELRLLGLRELQQRPPASLERVGALLQVLAGV